MSPESLSPAGGMDYRHLRKRYAPRALVCRRCDALLPAPGCPLERAECLYTSCLYACGLGQQADAARRRLVSALSRRCSTLSSSLSLDPACLEKLFSCVENSFSKQ